MKISLTFFLLLVGSAWSATEPKDTVNNAHLLYPFGKDVGDVETPLEDDGVSPEIHFSQPYTFYGKEYKTGRVNNNGIVSFGTTVQEYTPKAIPLNDGRAFAAVFWADCNNVQGGNVSYRQTEDPKLLSLISNDINQYYPDKHFKAKWALIATWYKVAFFGSLTNKRNTFQIVLVSSKDASYVILNYPEILWTTGRASGGNPMSGLGGSAAQIGFTKGNDKDYFSLPGSRSDVIVNVTKTTNVGVEGRWVVQVSEFEVKGLSDKDWEKLKKEDEARKAADAAREAEEAARREAEEAARREAEEAARREQAEREAKEAEEAAKKAEIPKEPEPEPEAQKTPDTPEKVPPETEDDDDDDDEEDCEW